MTVQVLQIRDKNPTKTVFAHNPESEVAALHLFRRVLGSLSLNLC